MASNPGVITDRSVSIGRVLSRAFETMGSNPVAIFGISLLFGAVPGLVTNYIGEGLRANAKPFDLAIVGFSIVSALLGIVFTMLVQGALVRATVAHSEGRVASFGECALAGLRVVLPLFFLGVLLGLGVVFGFLLLIVPGVMLYVMWIVAAPALVEERIGVFEAFGRSRYLTKGARWSVFAICLIFVVMYWIFSAVTSSLLLATYGFQGLAAAIQRGGLPIWYILITVIVSTLINAVVATIQTSLYVELKTWKDGPGTETLADVFA